jgi:hypothetical protein
LSELEPLRDQRNRTRQIRAHVDELIYVTDNRLALPRSGPMRFPVRVARMVIAFASVAGGVA